MTKMFSVPEQKIPTPGQAYLELLGGKSENRIVNLEIDLIDEIDNQPYQIHEDKIDRIAESMKITGQLEPVTVVPSAKNNGRYVLLAGRHRKRAAELLGSTTIQAIIKQETDPDKQRLILLATNNDRNNDYSPSERAFSYLEQQELLKKLGNSKTTSVVADYNDTNRKTVHKYIQLTNLDKSLLHRVDKDEITVGAGYELSFLPLEQQKKISIYLFNHSGQIHINKGQARQIRDNPDNIDEILNNRKTDISETLKTEKKIMPSETSKPFSNTSTSSVPRRDIDNKIPYETQMSIASCIYQVKYSIFKYIVSSFATPYDTEKFIHDRYCLSCGSSAFHINNDPYKKYTDCFLDFSKNSVSVRLISKKNEETYQLKLKEVDLICRRYLRKFVNSNDLILMLKEDNNNGN